jgi:hypothetical protein
VPDDRTYSGGRVRIAELCSADDAWLSGYSFTGCRIEGPAVLKIDDYTNMIGSSFDGPADEIFWSVTNHAVYGAIDVRMCHFEDCAFRAIGIIRERDLYERLTGRA